MEEIGLFQTEGGRIGTHLWVLHVCTAPKMEPLPHRPTQRLQLTTGVLEMN